MVVLTLFVFLHLYMEIWCFVILLCLFVVLLNLVEIILGILCLFVVVKQLFVAVCISLGVFGVSGHVKCLCGCLTPL